MESHGISSCNLLPFLPEAFLLQLFLGDLEAAAHRATWSTVAGDATFERSEVATGFHGCPSGEICRMKGPIFKAIYREYNCHNSIKKTSKGTHLGEGKLH